MFVFSLNVNLSASFDTAISAFLLLRQVKNLSKATIDWYHRRLKAFASFCQKHNETPATFSPLTVTAYLQQRCQRFTPQTANGDLRAIRAFSRWLVREAIRTDDPTKGIEKLKEPIHYPRTLSDDQIVALVNKIARHATNFAGLRDLALVTLLFDTGLRVSEATNLKLSDLDLA